MTSSNTNINASPTKEFFIHMLTRDVSLVRAVIDLIDNSVDGATRVSKNAKDLRDFYVRIELSKQCFRIVDNCGGISVRTAREYAFRFGRPPGVKSVAHTIGQFGVGMKRTIFKLGQEFHIKSTTPNSHFAIHQNVLDWTKDPSNWNFQFSELDEESSFEPSKVGTTVEVTQLHSMVAEQFELDSFIKRLAQEVKSAHSMSIERGLAIVLNEEPLTHMTHSVLQSELLKPVSYSREFSPTGTTPVKVKIVAGLSGERSLVRGGWYIFCNGRLVLEADQSEKTGWEIREEDHEDALNIPKYHADFAYFRGYVFFDSDDPSLLPWTTTKTGVDVDSPVFKSVRLDMMRAMRPILDFLRRLAEEKSLKERGEQSSTPLDDAVKTAAPVPHQYAQIQTTFQAPLPTPKPPRTTQRIQYDAQITYIEQVRQRMGQGLSLREIGEKTFAYYIEAECDE